MKLARFLLLFPALALYASALAQSASLTADTNALSPTGGTVMLTASAAYDGQPAALGWSIALPADWSLVSVGGSNLPQVVPDTGATGTLEFAYTTAPADHAMFTVAVSYPPNVSNASAIPTVILRANGKLVTLNPQPVPFTRATSDPHRKSDK